MAESETTVADRAAEETSRAERGRASTASDGADRGIASRLRYVGAVVWRATKSFIEDQALTQGAAIAFFSGLSLAPILLLLIWTSSVLGSETQDQLVGHVAELAGPESGRVVRIVIENADRNVDTANLAGWISLGIVLFSATAVFAQLQVALNAVWGVRPAPARAGVLHWLRKRLLSLGLILSFGFLLLVSLVVSSAVSALTGSLSGVLPGAEILWTVSDVVIPFFVYMAIFMALFRYLPDTRLRWRNVWFGGVVTSALFVLGKWLIGLYLGTSALGSAYGAAGSLVVMLVWTYYSASIVLFGAELTQAHVRARDEKIVAEPHAVPDTAERSPGSAGPNA